MNVELVVDARAELGEGPVWDERTGTLYWVDIGQHTIYRWDSATDDHVSFKPDMPVRGLCRRASGGWLLVTDTGLGFWDPSSDACEFIVNPFEETAFLLLHENGLDQFECDAAGVVEINDFFGQSGLHQP